MIFIILLLAGDLTRKWWLVTSERVTSWEDDVSADCGVVLTGSAHRIREAFALVSRNQIQKLVVSGVHPTTDFLDLASAEDVLLGVDPQKIILEKRSTTTYGNAKQTLPIVEGLGCNRVVLVTSQLHMYRSYWTFRAAFPNSIQIIKYSVPPTIMSASSLELSYEIVKTWFYSIWAL